ncbi:unannotated protein [freshwater metagenome]|uniref:Unannotated protein n=1 Tax=freshwater metagenome TaxID=449393 RepID=A0A6J5YFJ1_9ZZZZ
MFEAQVGHHPEFLGDMTEVPLDLRAASEILGPLVVLLEAELVGGAQCVDPDIRVFVDAPGAAEFGATFVHGVRDAELFELHRSRDTVEATTDDRDMEVPGRGRLTGLPVSEERVVLERKYLFAKFEITLWRRYPDDHLEK